MRLSKAGGRKAPLTSLSPEQEQLLTRASEGEGVYVGLFGNPVADQLVAGGAAEWRTVRRVGEGIRSATDLRRCEWDDFYLVPTAAGRALLGR